MDPNKNDDEMYANECYKIFEAGSPGELALKINHMVTVHHWKIAGELKVTYRPSLSTAMWYSQAMVRSLDVLL